MIFSSYYLFFKGKGKSRYDCICSTKDYETFEVLRNKSGELFLHLTGIEADYIKAISRRKPNFKLSKTKHISSLFVPNLENVELAYGDVIENQSALIVQFDIEIGCFEVYVAKGYRNHTLALFNKVEALEMYEEMKAIRSRSTSEKASAN